MSRYTLEIGGGVAVYGYDRPMRNFFLQLWNTKHELQFNIGTRMTLQPDPRTPDKMNYEADEFIEIAKDYGIPIPSNHELGILMSWEI